LRLLFALFAIAAVVGWPFYPYFVLRQIVFRLWNSGAITKVAPLFVVSNVVAVLCAGLTFLQD